MEFLVGTFYTPKLFTLRFTAPSTLEIIHVSTACGGHSWLSLSRDHRFLYTTVWTDPPAVAAYRVNDNGSVTFLNSKTIKAMSGYVVASDSHLCSVGGPSGEVFTIQSDGRLGPLVQELNFRSAETLHDGKNGDVAHGDFGGLRHGAHSVDFSADGRSLYVADIGHNCIWTYSVDSRAETTTGTPPLKFRMKWMAKRGNDGPRHTWPHPNGKVLYCLQEHSSMVDVLSIGADGTTLEFVQGVKIIPEDKDAKFYWADEVRVSRPVEGAPKYLYASTRGLDKACKGYVAAFRLNEDGTIDGEAIEMFETATSGGIANAIEPAPNSDDAAGIEYMTLTDSDEGWVFVLGFDGKSFYEAARTRLLGEDEKALAGATAVWL